VNQASVSLEIRDISVQMQSEVRRKYRLNVKVMQIVRVMMVGLKDIVSVGIMIGLRGIAISLEMIICIGIM
jgi:hypothetical protein